MTRPTPNYTPLRESGEQMHLAISQGDLPRFVLAPGDPGRVPRIGKFWDEYHEVAYNREFRSARGTYKGVEIGACSTGVGGPSTDIAINELANVGVDTIIRVGTCAALQPDINIGDLIINDAAVRLTGAPRHYFGDEYPAAATPEVVMALIEACEHLGFTCHVGISASVDSFYAGEVNPIRGGYYPSKMDYWLDDLCMAKVANFEMEAATLFVVGRILGLRTGCICVVGSNRIRRERKPSGDGLDNACHAACEAVRILHEWDALKKSQGKRYFSPSLLARCR